MGTNPFVCQANPYVYLFTPASVLITNYSIAVLYPQRLVVKQYQPYQPRKTVGLSLLISLLRCFHPILLQELTSIYVYHMVYVYYHIAGCIP